MRQPGRESVWYGGSRLGTGKTLLTPLAERTEENSKVDEKPKLPERRRSRHLGTKSAGSWEERMPCHFESERDSHPNIVTLEGNRLSLIGETIVMS